MNKLYAHAVFLFFFLNAVQVYSYNVTLKSSIVSGKEKICFKDIGELTGEMNDPFAKENWQKKCFMNLPQKEMVIVAKDLETHLWQGGFFPQNIIGEKIVIKPKHASISWQQLQFNLEKFFPPPEYLVELKEKKSFLVPKELEGKFKLDAKQKSVGTRTLYIQNSFKENIVSVPFVLMKRVTSYVTTQRIRKGETINKNNSIKKFSYSADVKTTNNIWGYVAQRDIPANTGINFADARKPAIVPSGSIVTLSYRHNRILFTMYAKTKESGYPGEKIKMQSSHGGRIIRAWLTGAETAEFKEENP